MKKDRKQRILEIIRTNDVSTQEELADILRNEGWKVTQATISRDIKELQLLKVAKASGKSCYAEAPRASHPVNERFRKILKETIQNINSAENLIVIHTLNGCANAAAEAIDTNKFPEIIGTLAGDNTILLIVDSKDHVKAIIDSFNEVIA